VYVFSSTESGGGGEHTVPGRAGRRRIRIGEITPSVDGQRGDNLVAHASTVTKVHLMLTDNEDLAVGVNFGACVIISVDSMIDKTRQHRFISITLCCILTLALWQ
jgi:hypothetical protein